MFMLNKVAFAPELYTMASTDIASGGSETQLYVNVSESANTLDPWEDVFAKAMKSLSSYGYEIDSKIAEDKLKPFYQLLRHGLSFDWVMNHVVSVINAKFPFSRYVKFKGTGPFIEHFQDDLVFSAGITELEQALQPIYDWVFSQYPDQDVFAKLSAYADGTNDIYEAIAYAEANPPSQPFIIPTLTLPRTAYLILLMEMISIAIGWTKRVYWTDRIFAIESASPGDQSYDFVVVVGGKFRMFAYGRIGDDAEAKWHLLNSGLKNLGFSERSQDSAYIRAHPDEMTFFRFADSCLYIDETMFPKVSFYEDSTLSWGPWITALSFKDQTLPVDTPLRMKVHYSFTQDPLKVKQIKIKGSLNCLIKDTALTLDSNGEASTQIVFRGNSASFIVSDVDKQYPFAVFNTDKIVPSDTFKWLD